MQFIDLILFFPSALQPYQNLFGLVLQHHRLSGHRLSDKSAKIVSRLTNLVSTAGWHSIGSWADTEQCGYGASPKRVLPVKLPDCWQRSCTEQSHRSARGGKLLA